MSSNLNIKGMNDNNLDIMSKEDAGVYFTALSESDVVFNVKQKLVCTSNGLKITIKSGQGCIQGHHFNSGGDANITVEHNTTGFIAIEFDKSKGIGTEYNLVSVPIIVKEDLLNEGLKRQLELYQYTSNDTTVDLVDNREFYCVDGVTNIKAAKSKDADKVNGHTVESNVPLKLEQTLVKLIKNITYDLADITILQTAWIANTDANIQFKKADGTMASPLWMADVQVVGVTALHHCDNGASGDEEWNKVYILNQSFDGKIRYYATEGKPVTDIKVYGTTKRLGVV